MNGHARPYYGQTEPKEVDAKTDELGGFVFSSKERNMGIYSGSATNSGIGLHRCTGKNCEGGHQHEQSSGNDGNELVQGAVLLPTPNNLSDSQRSERDLSTTAQSTPS